MGTVCCVVAEGADSREPSCEEWLVFEVTDTGCGISKQGLASLFTEYVQVSKEPSLRSHTEL